MSKKSVSITKHSNNKSGLISTTSTTKKRNLFTGKSVSITKHSNNKSGLVSTTTSQSVLGFWGLLLLILRYCFLVMLVIFVFRYALGRHTFSFAEFLNAIPNIGYNSDGVSYFEQCIEAFGSRDIFEFAESDSLNLPIIGGLVRFLSQVLGLLVYMASAIVSSLAYFVDLIGLLF